MGSVDTRSLLRYHSPVRGMFLLLHPYVVLVIYGSLPSKDILLPFGSIITGRLCAGAICRVWRIKLLVCSVKTADLHSLSAGEELLTSCSSGRLSTTLYLDYQYSLPESRLY
jgi:hypothetical protein